MLWKSSTPLQAIKADIVCMQEPEGTFSFGCSPSVYFWGSRGQECVGSQEDIPKLPAPKEKVPVISLCFESDPRPKSYLGQKQMLNEQNKQTNKQTKSGKKVKCILVLLQLSHGVFNGISPPYPLRSTSSHHFSHKTLCFPSLYHTAVAYVALGCVPLSLRHACVLRVHKMPAKQVMTKISECPEFSPNLKERKDGWSCPQDDWGC